MKVVIYFDASSENQRRLKQGKNCGTLVQICINTQDMKVVVIGAKLYLQGFFSEA